MTISQDVSAAALRAAPFKLDDAAVQWVEQTRASLSLDDQLRQLFNEASLGDDLEAARRLGAQRLGGVTRFVGADARAAWEATRVMLSQATVPLLISGDLEGGAIGMPCATPVPNQLGMAATDSESLTCQVAALVAAEGRALGFNWTFGPVVDINARHRSAIVATRSFGSDPDRILRLARAHQQAFQRAGLATTLKHWPGEGFDERDQHLLTTLNPLGLDEWETRFGRIYRSLIDQGALSVMSAHIAFPAWAAHCGATGVELYRPASVSRFINQDLLRGRLGFNGLIVSDATTMAGLGSWAARHQFLPEVIENGCDMILFSMDVEGDLQVLHRALADGRLSQQRVQDAVTRVLALKAALGLHRKTADERLPPLQDGRVSLPAHQQLGRQAAGQSVTLVKDVQGLLPISPARHRRVVLLIDRQRVGFANDENPAALRMATLLRERGFEVRDYDPAQPPTPASADLLMLVLAQESVYTQGNVWLDWRRITGSPSAAMRRQWHDLPCLLVSFGHPYYLFDAPRMPCVVNAYSGIESVQEAVVQRLLGEAPFTGGNPVDASCGLPDARY